MNLKRASIDLGTNTCLLLVIDGTRVLHDESRVVRLGQGVDEERRMHPDAMDRALACLIDYANIAKNFGIEPNEILAVGTAQARDARNAKEFFERVGSATGIQFKVLSGDEEAQATFMGAALPGMDPAKMLVMDIGGGSTEIVTALGGHSLNIGAVRITERFLKSDPVTDVEFWNAENAIDQEIRTLLEWSQSHMASDSSFVAVAGTAVTLGMLQLGLPTFDRGLLDGLEVTRGDAHRFVEELKWRTVAERQKMVGMELKRADVILGGALIYWRVMEVLNLKTSIVSTRGLRYGVLGLKP